MTTRSEQSECRKAEQKRGCAAVRNGVGRVRRWVRGERHGVERRKILNAFVSERNLVSAERQLRHTVRMIRFNVQRKPCLEIYRRSSLEIFAIQVVIKLKAVLAERVHVAPRQPAILPELKNERNRFNVRRQRDRCRQHNAFDFHGLEPLKHSRCQRIHAYSSIGYTPEVSHTVRSVYS